MQLGTIGIWTNRLDAMPANTVRECVAELDDLGFGTLWVSESAQQREAMANAALLLSCSERIVVATGVASIWARDAAAAVTGQRTLGEAWPNRFLLGVGVSHEALIRERGHAPGPRTLERMRHYLDAMDAVPAGVTPHPPEPVPRVLGALGPRMLELARNRSQGAHPLLVTPEHTTMARDVLGPGRLLCPEQALALGLDGDDAMETARTYVAFRLTFPNYRNHLARLGFGEHDLAHGGSDRLVRELVAVGDLNRVADRVRQHLDAGATHVALQALVPPETSPVATWRHLALVLPDFPSAHAH